MSKETVFRDADVSMDISVTHAAPCLLIAAALPDPRPVAI